MVVSVGHTVDMRNHVANFGIRLGKRLTWWFTVAWQAMFALWIASGGLEVDGVYLASEAQEVNLPVILTWAAVNVALLIGWHTVTTRQRGEA